MQFHFKDALRIQSVFVCFYAVKFSPLKIGTGTIPEPAPKPNLCSYLILPRTFLGKYTVSTHTVK